MAVQHLICFLKRLLLLCAIYGLSRWGFFLYNFDSGQGHVLLPSMLEGLRFDMSALLYINIPFFALLIFHFFWPQSNGFKRLINVVFYALNIPFILLNNIDIAFYTFNLKRSTIDLFSSITYPDFKNVYLGYVVEYWPLSLLSILQIAALLSVRSLPKVPKRSVFAILTVLCSTALLVVGMRGAPN